MVIAPHPDDAVLGAAGMMQRAQYQGWQVVAVHMTHGDGFALSTWRMRQATRPADYVAMGHLRRKEAITALRVLGVQPQDCLFLGFPDGQLSHLTINPLASPTTHCAQDPYADSPSFGQPYTYTHWAMATRQILIAYQPAMVVYPDIMDTNADHRATGQLIRQLAPSQATLTYRVHGRKLPHPSSHSPASPLAAITLTESERSRKQLAIALHPSQLAVTGWWLNAFAQPTEPFTRP